LFTCLRAFPLPWALAYCLSPPPDHPPRPNEPPQRLPLAPSSPEFFLEVVRRTGRLAALWQSVGFCHGVLNTDNMSIVGLTIDYGPYAFMDRFDPGFTCNGSGERARFCVPKLGIPCAPAAPSHVPPLPLPPRTHNPADNDSRYSYEKQPEMCKWNCGKLGEVLAPLLGTDWDWRAAVAAHFDAAFEGEYNTRMAHKVSTRKPTCR
jgi:uncharacterized protein YdiU (UPF0061 family)